MADTLKIWVSVLVVFSVAAVTVLVLWVTGVFDEQPPSIGAATGNYTAIFPLEPTTSPDAGKRDTANPITPPPCASLPCPV